MNCYTKVNTKCYKYYLSIILCENVISKYIHVKGSFQNYASYHFYISHVIYDQTDSRETCV